MECIECDGIGSIVRACRHGANAPCRCQDTVEVCEACDGRGRLCAICGDPMALSEPREAVSCGPCLVPRCEDCGEELQDGACLDCAPVPSSACRRVPWCILQVGHPDRCAAIFGEVGRD